MGRLSRVWAGLFLATSACAGGQIATDDLDAGPPPADAAATCTDGVKNGAETDVDCGGGTCAKCNNGKKCGAAGDCSAALCTSGICGACTIATTCPNGASCVNGFCGTCKTNAECAPGEACKGGSCGPCSLKADCGTGEICNLGRCAAGEQISMYTCPGIVSLGGGSWGFYGCQNQLTNTPTCNEIEAPKNQTFNCTYTGKLNLVAGNAPAPLGATAVQMYQCPPSVSLGGGAWGYYGCQGQITNTPTCSEIEYPKNQTFACTPIGTMMVSSSPPPVPPGGKAVPLFQCPGSVSLGGGAWGFYGCQSQLTNTATCVEIEAPTQQSFACPPAGNIVLEP